MVFRMEEIKVYEGLENIYVCRSDISKIEIKDNEVVLEYRGYNIKDLARHSSFEEVAYLLLYGELPTKSELQYFSEELKALRELPPQVIGLLTHLPPITHPMVALRTAISYLGSLDKDLHDLSYDGCIKKAKSLIAKFPTIVAYYHRIRSGQELVHPSDEYDHAGNFLYMLHGRKPSKTEAKSLDLDLVLHADHELNASTFAARIAASTFADMYACVVAATGTLMGHLHGGAAQKVMEMLREILVPWKAEAWVKEKLERKERIMGFGHRVYKGVVDPRTVELRSLAKKLAKERDSRWFEVAEAIAKAVYKFKKLLPNIDFYSACIYASLGIPDDLFVNMFALGRIVGWTAHIIEQYQNNKLIRPRALYVGKTGRKYIPITQRG